MLSTLQQDRIAREFMIAEQNRAYQESLDADREKVVFMYMYKLSDDLYRMLCTLPIMCMFRRGKEWRRKELRKKRSKQE